jgi:microcystin-dependent protein
MRFLEKSGSNIVDCNGCRHAASALDPRTWRIACRHPNQRRRQNASGTLDGRIFESLDNGKTWQPRANFGKQCLIQGIYECNGKLYAQVGIGRHSFVAESRDGRTWYTLNWAPQRARDCYEAGPGCCIFRNDLQSPADTKPAVIKENSMSEPFLAEIRIFSFGFAPRGWANCSGQLLPINQNQALFSLLGTTFGGNGSTTFALPDLRGCTPVHVGGGFTLGQRAGEEAHTLTQAEMPTHTHVANGVTVNGNGPAPTNSLLAGESTPMYAPPDSNLVSLVVGSIALAGGSQPHSNMQPYLVLNFCIAVQGIFPSRN